MDQIKVEAPTENVSSLTDTQESAEVPTEITPANEFVPEDAAVPAETQEVEQQLPTIKIPDQPVEPGGEEDPKDPTVAVINQQQ